VTHLELLAAAIKAYDATVEHCAMCGATWTVDEMAECRWCADAHRRLLEDQRQALLHPEWAQQRDARYYQLSPEDQKLWDQTRGIPRRGDGAITFHGERLRRGVECGLITMHEASQALKRVTAWERAA
jgi:hypothetical protein